MKKEPDSKPEPDLLKPGEVAAMFAVDPKTVTRWAKLGKLNTVMTLGGHRRYRASEVRELVERASNKPPKPPK